MTSIELIQLDRSYEDAIAQQGMVLGKSFGDIDQDPRFAADVAPMLDGFENDFDTRFFSGVEITPLVVPVSDGTGKIVGYRAPDSSEQGVASLTVGESGDVTRSFIHQGTVRSIRQTSEGHRRVEFHYFEPAKYKEIGFRALGLRGLYHSERKAVRDLASTAIPFEIEHHPDFS